MIVETENIRTQFARKVQGCFEEYQTSWKKLQPEELIEQAGEIHTIQQLAEELPRSASEEDMAYLLRFKNPLEVASVAWCNSVGYSIASDELDHTLWELRDQRILRWSLNFMAALCQISPCRSNQHCNPGERQALPT